MNVTVNQMRRSEFLKEVYACWCFNQVFTQPSVLPLFGWTGPTFLFREVGGEVGQTSLERSDAWTSSLMIRSSIPTESKGRPDHHGPLDPKVQ